MSVRVWKHPDVGVDVLRFQFDGGDGTVYELGTGVTELVEVEDGIVPSDWHEMTSPDYDPNHNEETSWSV